jgi:hypothetical protein
MAIAATTISLFIAPHATTAIAVKGFVVWYIMEESIQKKQRSRISGYPLKSYNTASCTIDGETLIVSSTDQKIYVLNKAGTRIWELADGFHSVDDITWVLTRTSKKNNEDLRKDVERFVLGLIKKKVLVVLERPLDYSKIR